MGPRGGRRHAQSRQGHAAGGAPMYWRPQLSPISTLVAGLPSTASAISGKRPRRRPERGREVRPVLEGLDLGFKGRVVVRQVLAAGGRATPRMARNGMTSLAWPAAAVGVDWKAAGSDMAALAALGDLRSWPRR